MSLPAVLFMLLHASGAYADTFTNKLTRETLTGRLLGTIEQDGKEMIFVRTTDGKRLYLPQAEWVVERDLKGLPPEPKGPPQPAGVTYRGQRRSDEWVEQQFAAFRSKFTVLDGQIVDISKPERWQSTISPGEACTVRGTVVQTLGPAELLVRLHRHPWKLPERFEHVFAFDVPPTVKAADGQLICLSGHSAPSSGTEIATRVAATGGGKVKDQTVVECQPLPHHTEPLTREQFLLVLRLDLPLGPWERCFVLKRYKEIVLDPVKRFDPRHMPPNKNATLYLILSPTRDTEDEVYCDGWRRRPVE
jgi:hypothetical protein